MKKLIVLLTAIITVSATFAQKAGKKDTLRHLTLYTCSMHDTVAAKKPGNCPVCGMKLHLSKKEQMKMDVTKSYSCPMHLQEVSDKPGKCSKCGMDLVLTAKEKMKAEVAHSYACPMKCEGDKTYDKEGKCPKCGMALKEVKHTEAHH